MVYLYFDENLMKNSDKKFYNTNSANLKNLIKQTLDFRGRLPIFPEWEQ